MSQHKSLVYSPFNAFLSFFLCFHIAILINCVNLRTKPATKGKNPAYLRH